MSGPAETRLKVSVILIARNEAQRIRRCLESVKWADEIVVVDQSSIDDTAQICREYTDKVFMRPAKGTANPDREFALSKTAHDWILYVDADEVVTEALRDEILALLRMGPRFTSYRILFHNICVGKVITASGWYPNYIIRFFRKDSVVCSALVHVPPRARGESGQLSGVILHYSYDSIDHYEKKINRYTDLLAGQAFGRGKRVTPLTFCSYFIYLPFAYFIKKYIVQKGFTDGFRGLLIAYGTFWTVFVMHAKIGELQRSGGGRPETVSAARANTRCSSCESIEEQMRKSASHTSSEAGEQFERGERITPLSVIWFCVLKPFAVYMRNYIFMLNLLGGMRGFLTSSFAAKDSFFSAAKLWEIQMRRGENG